ncbi:MAG TPA: cyanophycin synthetase, partial [Rugosibacter sp.]
MEAWVDIGVLEESPSNTLPGFNERLTTLLPTLIEHRCSYGEQGGFLKRLEEGTWPAHILEHVTLELQNLAGMPGGFGKARSTSQRGVYKVAVRSWHEDITRQALLYGRDLVMAAINATAFDVPAAVAHLAHMADRLLLGPSTQAIVEAATAKQRRIPAIRLSEGNLVQLGYGIHGRRIWTAETDTTSAIAESISRDKSLTNTLLRSCGVPVPEGSIVKSATEAWDEAQAMGLPVVLKPVDGNHGRGVSVGLSHHEDIEAAFALAQEAGSEVLVERFIPG